MSERAQEPDPYDVLDELYDEWVVSVLEDLPFYVELVASVAERRGRTSLRVVELGAGSGRVALPIASCGHEVVAIDTSHRQLARLSEQAARQGLTARVRAVRADMRELAQFVEPATVDVVIAPFRSLLHVADAREAVFRAARSVLRPGGVLAFDVFHPSAETIAQTHGHWLLRRSVASHDEPGRWDIFERARYDNARERLELTVRCDWTGEHGGRRRGREAVLHLQTPPPHAWRDSLRAAGFELHGVYGWFDERPYQPADEDSVWAATAGPAAQASP